MMPNALLMDHLQFVSERVMSLCDWSKVLSWHHLHHVISNFAKVKFSEKLLCEHKVIANRCWFKKNSIIFGATERKEKNPNSLNSPTSLSIPTNFILVVKLSSFSHSVNDSYQLSLIMTMNPLFITGCRWEAKRRYP